MSYIETKEQKSTAVVTGALSNTERKQGLEKFQIIFALLSLYIIWGATYLGMAIAIKTMPPLLMSGARFIVAGLVLYLILRARKYERPTAKQWLGGAITGLFFVVIGNGGVTIAEDQNVTSGLAAVAVAAMPLWAALFFGFLGRWPRALEWVGLLVGFSGVILLNLGNNLWSEGWLGPLLLILAPMGWAFGSAISSKLTLAKGVMSSATQMLTGGVVMVLIAFAFGEYQHLQMPSLESWVAWVFLIIFGSLIAYSSYTYLLGKVRPALATSYAYVNPAVAVALGAFYAQEPVTWLGIVAMLVILSGVGLLSLNKLREQQS